MRRSPLVLLSLLAAATLAPGCQSSRDGRDETGAPLRAVVIFEPSRAADGETARTLLRDAGWRVWLEPSGPVRRTKSSLALYGLAFGEARALDAAEILSPLGRIADPGDEEDGTPVAIERLAFLQAGPGGTAAVLWLAD